MKNHSCEICFCGYVGSMKWQQFLPLVLVVGAAVVMIWRSSGKKADDCGCKCGCTHDHDGVAKKEDAVN